MPTILILLFTYTLKKKTEGIWLLLFAWFLSSVIMGLRSFQSFALPFLVNILGLRFLSSGHKKVIVAPGITSESKTRRGNGNWQWRSLPLVSFLVRRKKSFLKTQWTCADLYYVKHTSNLKLKMGREAYIWLELCHIVTSSCKEGWESKYLVFSTSTGKSGKRERACE